MTKKQFDTIEMLGNVVGFGRTQAANIPSGSVTALAVAAIQADLAKVSEMGIAPGEPGTQPGTTVRDAARATLRQLVQAIHDTSAAVAIDRPGADTYFQISEKAKRDQALIKLGQNFIKYATPLKDEFIAHHMPATFLDTLQAAVSGLQQAIVAQNQAKGDQKVAAMAFEEAVEDALTNLQRLDAAIPNLLGHDPAAMAAWKVARYMKRDTRRKTPVNKKQPVVTTGTTPDPTSATPSAAAAHTA